MEQMQTELWHTQNDLPERVRRDAISHLNQQLADAVDLHLQAKQAHWNVKGANFFALHELFDAVGEELEELADELLSGRSYLVEQHWAPHELQQRGRGCPFIRCRTFQAQTM